MRNTIIPLVALGTVLVALSSGLFVSSTTAQETAQPELAAGIKERLRILERELTALKERQQPLLADEDGKRHVSNIIRKEATGDTDLKLVVKPLRECRLLVVSELEKRSTVCEVELLIDGVRKDYQLVSGGDARENHQRKMSALIDVKRGQVVEIESRKLKKPSNIGQHRITVFAMPIQR